MVQNKHEDQGTVSDIYNYCFKIKSMKCSAFSSLIKSMKCSDKDKMTQLSMSVSF